MERWGFTEEVKKSAKRRRRIADKQEVREQKPLKEADEK